ncbi:MAG TPA: nitroreductase family deazaflavin-dependent oxidoreductase [Gaiellaceae bacterium]|jgi:deazaflavin-dependent oxidoreductase (nitroreductase family)|nr:nitroreductase family deazaflavin-dependent oxidoreductase [Gaiellaceae bacterium]
MSEEKSWNQQVIEEFRENDGRVGGRFEGAPLLLLHHTGSKTGNAYVNPLMYQEVDGGWAIFASKGGHTEAPAWYGNLLARPETQIELGTETIDVTARDTAGEERDRIWEAQKRAFPQFAEYEKTANRTIPVVVLERR